MSQQKMSRGTSQVIPAHSCWDPCNLGSSLVLFLAAVLTSGKGPGEVEPLGI